MQSKLLHAVYQPYKYGVYIPFLAGSTLFFGSLTVAMVPLTSARFAGQACGATWARLNGLLTPIRVAVSGRENVDEKQSYVIVSNHQSHFDVFVLYGWLGIDFKWVMKQELRKIPGLGIGCEMIGHVFIVVDAMVSDVRISILAAVLFAVGQLAVTYARSRRFEWLVLIDVGLIPPLGAISIAFDNELFFEVKPAIWRGWRSC